MVPGPPQTEEAMLSSLILAAVLTGQSPQVLPPPAVVPAPSKVTPTPQGPVQVVTPCVVTTCPTCCEQVVVKVKIRRHRLFRLRGCGCAPVAVGCATCQ